MRTQKPAQKETISPLVLRAGERGGERGGETVTFLSPKKGWRHIQNRGKKKEAEKGKKESGQSGTRHCKKEGGRGEGAGLCASDHSIRWEEEPVPGKGGEKHTLQYFPVCAKGREKK